MSDKIKDVADDIAKIDDMRRNKYRNESQEDAAKKIAAELGEDVSDAYVLEVIQKLEGAKKQENGDLYQIVPYDEEGGNQPPAPEEFNSMEAAEEFLDKTSERWDGWQSVQIVEKATGKVVDVW